MTALLWQGKAPTLLKCSRQHYGWKGEISKKERKDERLGPFLQEKGASSPIGLAADGREICQKMGEELAWIGQSLDLWEALPVFD